jgi:branched-chain amino acid transport system substrate-binding protein
MKKFFLIVCMTLSLIACDKQESDKPIVKVGASLPLTGNMSHIGISAKNALQMAIDKWNAIDTKFKYQLIVEDDAFEAKKVATITNKFVNVDKVKAVFSVFSIGANVISPITEKAKIIHMTCAYGSQPADGFYNFNNITQYENQTDLMLQELKNRKIKSIALLISNNIGSTQQAEILQNKIKKDKTIKIIATETFNPGTIDFRQIIQKILSKGKPDIFYVDGITPDANLVAKTLKEITGKVNLTTINDFIETPERENFEGLWFVESASGTEQFNQEYKNKYGSQVFLCGANMYDNLDLFIEAYEKFSPETVDNDKVVQTLLSIKDKNGAIGNFSIDEHGIIQSHANVKIIKNGLSVNAK